MFLLWKYLTSLSEVLEILIEITELLEKLAKKEENRRSQNEKNVLQLRWLNIQDQDGAKSSKRKDNLEKPEFPISLKLEVPDIFIQQQGA